MERHYTKLTSALYLAEREYVGTLTTKWLVRVVPLQEPTSWSVTEDKPASPDSSCMSLSGWRTHCSSSVILFVANIKNNKIMAPENMPVTSSGAEDRKI